MHEVNVTGANAKVYYMCDVCGDKATKSYSFVAEKRFGWPDEWLDFDLCDKCQAILAQDIRLLLRDAKNKAAVSMSCAAKNG